MRLGLSTGFKRANKSNFVLHCRNCPFLEMKIGWRWFLSKNGVKAAFLDWQAMYQIPCVCLSDLMLTSCCFDLDKTIDIFWTNKGKLFFFMLSYTEALALCNLFFAEVAYGSLRILSSSSDWMWSFLIKHMFCCDLN